MPRAKSIAARRSNRTREKNSVCFCLCCFFSNEEKSKHLEFPYWEETATSSAPFLHEQKTSLFAIAHTAYISNSVWMVHIRAKKQKRAAAKTDRRKEVSKWREEKKKEIFQPTDKYTTDYMKMKRNICMSQVSLFARTAAYAAAALAMVFACLALVVCARLWAQFDRGKL